MNIYKIPWATRKVSWLISSTVLDEVVTSGLRNIFPVAGLMIFTDSIVNYFSAVITEFVTPQ